MHQKLDHRETVFDAGLWKIIQARQSRQPIPAIWATARNLRQLAESRGNSWRVVRRSLFDYLRHIDEARGQF